MNRRVWWGVLLAIWSIGCGDDADLPQTLEHEVFVADLLLVGESVAAGARQRVPKYSPHSRAVIEVPPKATLSWDARITRNGEEAVIGPVEIVVQIDGDEVARRQLEAEARYLAADGVVPLDEYAGRTVTVELIIDRSESRPGTGFYWHRAVIERLEQVPRMAAGRGRNLLFVVVDTLRADHTSLYGYERRTTPHLDALAESSLVYDHAFAPASWTLPSTATLFTGLAPPAHGIVGGGHHLALRFETLAERLAGAGVTTFGVSANPLIGPNLSFEQGFETFVHRPWERADALHEAFLDWLDRADEHRWFAYIHAIDPHDPYDAPGPGRRWVDPAYDGPFTEPALLNQLYRTVNWGLEPPREVEARDLQYLRDAYDGEILYWDAAFGALLAALDERGVLDDTIVVVTSDHGEEFLDHGGYKHGNQLYDESLRVPLVIHAPGLVERGRRGDPVSLQGLYRALLQLMRLGPPANDEDLLRPPTPRAVFGHTRVQVAPDDARNRYTVASVRDGRWWLVYEADDDRRLLFDLEVDPEQRRDLAAARPEVVARLGARLDAWLSADVSETATPTEIDPEALEQLRALGYVQ